MLKKLRWNTIPCPVCRVPSGVKLRQCPFCQTDFTSAAMRKRNDKALNRKIKVVAFFVATISLALLMIALAEPKPGNSQASADWPAPGSASRQVTATYRMFRAQLEDARQGCESASIALDLTVQAMRSGSANHYDGRRRTLYTQRACQAAATSITALTIPDELPDAARTAAQATIRTCNQAMTARYKAARTAYTVLAGDMQPTTIEAVAQINLAAQSGMLACTDSLNSLAGAAGVDLVRLRSP